MGVKHPMLAMPSLEDDGRRELLILDTGPIRELVLHQAVFRLGFDRLRSELRWLTNKAAYTRCGRFIAAFKRKTTSASVAAELNHWIRTTEQHGQEKLWNRVYEEFRQMAMDEEVVKLLEMDLHLVARFGPIDTSLLGLAVRHQQEYPTLLTSDRALHGEFQKAGLHVSLLHKISS